MISRAWEAMPKIAKKKNCTSSTRGSRGSVSSMINSMPRTKEDVMDWCSDEDDDDDEEEHVHGNPKVQKLPKTAKNLYNRFKILHCQYLRYGKYENRNDLILLLDEMLRHKFITQEDDEKAANALDIDMSDGEERPISEDVNGIIKSTVNYIIAHDKEELLAELKEEVTEYFIDGVLQLEKLIDAFLTDDYLGGEPLLPMIDETLDGCSTNPRSKQQRLKMVAGDIISRAIDILFILYSHG